LAPTTLVALAVLGCLALLPLPYWMLRSWRTYGLLIGAAVLVGLAELAALQPQPALQTGLVAGVGWALLTRNESFWAMPRADRRFVDDYAAIRTDLKALGETVDTTSPAEYEDRFSELIARLERIHPPSADWAALKRDTEEDLRRRLSAMRAGTVLPDEEVEAFKREWKELDDQFVVLIRRKTTFWLLWP